MGRGQRGASDRLGEPSVLASCIGLRCKAGYITERADGRGNLMLIPEQYEHFGVEADSNLGDNRSRAPHGACPQTSHDPA